MTNPTEITVNGERLLLYPQGAVYQPAEDALIVADLHFEKGSSFAARGVMLPPYDTRATLRRLAAVAREIAPRRIISLGDAFHDQAAEERMDAEDADLLRQLISAHDWLWILGNHDPAPPSSFGGRVEHDLCTGSLFLTHEPHAQFEPGELAGHLHPCARARTGASTLRRRCFIGDGARLILPAFGAYTGGLNVLDDAFAPLFRDGFCAWVMGGEGVYPFDPTSLAPDPPNLARIAG